MTPTRELFEVIVRRASRDPQNGLALWQSIKPLLQTRKYRAYRELVMELPEFDSDGQIIQLHHFYIQCVRIPLSEPMTLRKLIQVALSVGQVIGSVIAKKYSLFLELNMDKYDTYVGDNTNTNVFDDVSQEVIHKVERFFIPQ